MTIKYKDNYYEIVGAHEPKTRNNYDLICIFQAFFIGEDGTPRTKEQYEEEMQKFEDNKEFEIIDFKLGELVNYFYGESVETKTTIELIAIDYIEEYLKVKREEYLKALEKAQKEEIEKRLKKAYYNAYKTLSQSDDKHDLEKFDNELYNLLDYIVEELENEEK